MSTFSHCSSCRAPVASEPPPAAGLVDEAVRADLFDALGEHDVRLLWHRLLEGMPAYVERLGAAVAAGDAVLAASTAHAIKGAALNLGLTALGEAGKALEMAARTGTTPLAPLFGALRAAERLTRRHIHGD